MSRAPASILALATGLASPLGAQETPITVARSVVDRMPVDTAVAFPADVGQVTCWTRVTGAAGTTIQHVWIHGENEYPVTLNVGVSPWWTCSTKSIPPEWAGEWRVEIRDVAGTVLTIARFTVGS